MQMGNKEIAVDYRRAANKQKQIKILAELNQCAERKIAEILVEEGEELPKKWQEQLQKPSRRSWKFPEYPEAPETEPPEAPEATEPAPMTAEAVPTAAPEKSATVTLDPTAWDRGALERKVELGEISAEACEASLITREDVCLGACKNLLAALDLKPDEFHCYACGTLDLVFSLLGVPTVWQPIHDRRV